MVIPTKITSNQPITTVSGYRRVLKDKTIADKLMYIPNDDTVTLYYNWWLKRLDTQLNELINQKIPQSC